MNCDVVVVGGGPAGSVTALLLARAGFHVILLERSEFPRHKPCGDCLSPAANPILRRIGVWDAVTATRPALLRGWKLTSHGEQTFAARFETITDDRSQQVALAVERSTFDAVLLRAAEASGVHVLHGARVTGLLWDEDAVRGVSCSVAGTPTAITADFTVGADGLRSTVARRLRAYSRMPRLRKASFTMHVDWPADAALGEMRLRNDACLGIARVSEATRRSNLTLVLKHGSFDQRAGVRSIVRHGLTQFGIVLDEIAPEQILASGPFDWPVRNVAFAGAALVGDAAGYYDPFTGQGIYQALAGAEFLAHHAGNALRNQRVRNFARSGYAEAHRSMTAGARRVQRIIEFVCARPRLSDYAFARFDRDPVLAAALVAITGDLVSPNSIFAPRLLMRLVT